ncbi:MAG: MerR family transcriptional regulator [Natronospirillum sp.]|uniref:MerR family transcriptional regulator n=1 Tax=Natronospirillum sp. TaxID=2812955 RepID=UPI0025D67412|nr:MerR family transcriptional regulator [Natronospirillum sp.]MCH8551621.1 MerR family transcriptional regulator [Natronospirillum sp.]
MNETALLFSMAETSRRTGVSTATLRKWAARYDIDASHRSPGGHRLYSESDLERLQRIGELKARGWNLADLAALSTDDLRRMSPLDSSEDIPARICFCGTRIVGEFAPWFAERARTLEEVEVSLATGVLVWEVGSLSDQHVARIQRLTQSGVPVLLVYHYALGRRLQQLEAMGVQTQSGPLDWATLMHWLLQQTPKARYSDQDLEALIRATPELPCECPRHLAELLVRLRGFAAYCQQCSLDSPEQADLHQRLFHWTQAAQRPLESGLQAVIEHDNLDWPQKDSA